MRRWPWSGAAACNVRFERGGRGDGPEAMTSFTDTTFTVLTPFPNLTFSFAFCYGSSGHVRSRNELQAFSKPFMIHWDKCELTMAGATHGIDIGHLASDINFAVAGSFK